MSFSEGMMAVVRGIQEATGGLAVTLVDGDRQYTLLPNPAISNHMQNKQPFNQTPHQPFNQTAHQPYNQTADQPYNQTDQPHKYAPSGAQPADPPPRGSYDAGVQGTPYVYDSSAQAVDGQYASVYRLTHCSLQPTSPPFELTEFPPQRAVPALRGKENFVVGGSGSGASPHHSPTRNKMSIRNCRSSRGPDSFSKSLRSYKVSPERSSEVVERLVQYSNMGNDQDCRQKNKRPSKFCSLSSESTQQDHQFDARPSMRRQYPEDSPTSDKWASDSRPYSRNMDVHNCRKAKQFSTYPYNHPVSPSIKERYDHLPPQFKATHSVNMETQASVPTVSREITTAPRPQPVMRNIAVSPLSSAMRHTDTKQQNSPICGHAKSISIQTKISNVRQRKSVQTCFSSVNIRNNNIKQKRRSKSQEELRIHYLDEEIEQFVNDLTKPSDVELTYLKNKLLKKLRRVQKAERDKARHSRWDKEYPNRNLKAFTTELSNDLISKMKRQNIIIQPTNIYRANYVRFSSNNEEHDRIDEVLTEWVNNIPIKILDYLGRPVIKEILLKTIEHKVRNILNNKSKYCSEASTKADIIDLLEDLPIDITGHNRRIVLNRLVTELINKIKDAIIPKATGSRFSRPTTSLICHYIQPTQDEMKDFVENEITKFKYKFNIEICSETFKIIVNELSGIMIESLELIKQDEVRLVIDEILTLLAGYLSITETQAVYLAINLVNDVRVVFEPRNSRCNLKYSASTGNQRSSNESLSIKENHVEDYTKHIVEQIHEWLSSFTFINQVNPNSIQVVVNDLAGDIIDRYLYLEKKSPRAYAAAEELEHLKYQIFKYINKIVGEGNMETISRASELMQRIQNVLRLNSLQKRRIMLNYPSRNSQLILRQEQEPALNQRRHSATTERSPNLAVSERRHTDNGALQRDTRNNQPDSRGNSRPGPSTDRTAAQNQSLKLLNEEFDTFLKNWVLKVPIAAANEEEEAIAEKARLGLYIGVWKAITKLKMNSEIIDNPYHYEDGLDDELEVLLQCLPQTAELKGKKHMLKSQLIEKTMKINYQVGNVTGVSSYKQQLIDHVNNNLPKQTDIDFTGKDMNRLYEDWEKMLLAELYIIVQRYKDTDKVRAMAYKKKLMRHAEQMIEHIKATHNKDLHEIDDELYKEEILAALDEVPRPTDATILREGDEILIALEIEQWFDDLPLLPNEKQSVKLVKRVYQDMLARKLYDIDKHCDPSMRNDLMKREIRRFLERMPLRQGQADNINFMIEELLNRINNINNDLIAMGRDRKSGTIMDGYEYDDFSRSIAACSSFNNYRPRMPIDESSYFIRDGTRVRDVAPMADPVDGSLQYFTIESGGPMPQCCGTVRNAPDTSCIQPAPVNKSCSKRYQAPGPSQKNQSGPSCPHDAERSINHETQAGNACARNQTNPVNTQNATTSSSNLNPNIPVFPGHPGTKPLCCTHEQADKTPVEHCLYPPPSDQTGRICCPKPNENQRQGYPPRQTTPNTEASQRPNYTAESGTSPKPTTLDNGTNAPCNSRRDYHQPQNLLDPSQERPRSSRQRSRQATRNNDSGNDTDHERCRCMEKIRKCRRRICEYPDCRDLDDMRDYVPCFMKMERSCYY